MKLQKCLTGFCLPLVLTLVTTSAFAQNVGIGFSDPQSQLTVNGNFAIGSGFNGAAPANGAGIQGPLFVGGTLANMTGYPNSGAGTYLFFDPTAGSLYAGTVTGTDWNDVNRGSDDAVFGVDNLVSGDQNLVGGSTNTVSGLENLVAGYGNNVAAHGNVVGGAGNALSGSTDTNYNLVVGVSHTLTNSGSGAPAPTNGNLVVGWQNSVSDTDNSCALGHLAVVDSGAQMSFVFSDGTATTTATAFGEWVVRETGGVYFYASSSNTGVKLAPGATSWTSASDVRAKENIRDLGYGLNAVLAMKPLIYNYKGNPTGDKALGFTAQDMQKIVPEVVDVPKDSSAMMGIRYTELVPVLAKAIQELKQEKDTQIHTLETKETALENENAALKTEVAELKTANERLAGIAADMEALKKAVATIREKEVSGVRTVAVNE
jgi:hypothetical protein